MPTILDLINYEQLANALFLISTFYAIASGNEATRNELEKRRGTPPSGSVTSATNSVQFALISTWYSVAAYIIYTLAAIARKSQLERDIRSGTTNVSIVPNILIIEGFILATIGTIIRIPALEQRLREAQQPVVL